MKKSKAIVSVHEQNIASYKSYVTGFIMSLVLTLCAYSVVRSNHSGGQWSIAILLGILALIQFLTQLILFLHLGKESRPRFKLLVFGFMVTVVLILVAGSIWIMYNLNHHMMTPNRINTYMNNQDGGI